MSLMNWNMESPPSCRPMLCDNFIRAEGFNTPPLGAVKTGIKPRVQPPYENNIPRPLVAGLLIVTQAVRFFYQFIFLSQELVTHKIIRIHPQSRLFCGWILIKRFFQNFSFRKVL
jgi:hypothetical protein